MKETNSVGNAAKKVSFNSTNKPSSATEGDRIPQSIIRASKGEGLISLLFVAGLIAYALAFYVSLAGRWFSPMWTTDDALQQTYPFHAVFHPHIFDGDLITKVMVGYLAPAHYWMSYLATYLTESPIMAGHFVMLLQLGLTVFFLFGAVKHFAGIVPACFATTWFLHTRLIVQRLTGGLPRGWAAVLFAGFFYLLFKRKHKSILGLLFLGCLLHPPATLLIAVAYGMFLTFGVLVKRSRAATLKPFLTLLFLSPVYVGTVFYVVKRPPEIGQMVTYEEAASMPEFLRPDGRFPFIPLNTIEEDLRIFAYQAFVGRLYNPGHEVRRALLWILPLSLVALLAIAAIRQRWYVPKETLVFLAATGVVYLLARQLAFKLYVPNRHLQLPLAFFFFVAYTIAFWNIGKDLIRNRWGTCSATVALVILGSAIVFCSGSGLNGDANFNTYVERRGKLWEWVSKYTPETALIAGEPTHVDGAQLFGMRRAFVTTETSHPFYPKYYQEMKRRLEIVLKAHYSRDPKEFVSMLRGEGVDFFVFKRKSFYPSALAEASYLSPFDGLVRELASYPANEYVYKAMPKRVNLEKYPFLVYRDDLSAVVDVQSYERYLNSGL